jgi:hypothetical protein
MKTETKLYVIAMRGNAVKKGRTITWISTSSMRGQGDCIVLEEFTIEREIKQTPEEIDDLLGKSVDAEIIKLKEKLAILEKDQSEA